MEELERRGIPVRIQMVVSAINYDELSDMITFCEGYTNITELKLLDLSEYSESWRGGESGNSYWQRNYVSLGEVERELERANESVGTAWSVGGYGNPMNVYATASGLLIRLRRSDRGAFYGAECEACPAYSICGDGHCNLELGPNRLIKVCRSREGKVFALGQEHAAIEYFRTTTFLQNETRLKSVGPVESASRGGLCEDQMYGACLSDTRLSY